MTAQQWPAADEDRDRLTQLPRKLARYRRGDWLTRAEVSYFGEDADDEGRRRWAAAVRPEFVRLFAHLPGQLREFRPELWAHVGGFNAWCAARAEYAAGHGWPGGALERIAQQRQVRRQRPYTPGSQQ